MILLRLLRSLTKRTMVCNLTVHFFFLLSVVLRSKGKRMSVDKAALPAVQFHPLASSPPKSPPPLPKEAPPPPRPKRPSMSEKVPPKPPSSAGRGALLSQIQKGTRLKATKTNDKSAPRVWETKWYHVLVSSANFVSSCNTTSCWSNNWLDNIAKKLRCCSWEPNGALRFYLENCYGWSNWEQTSFTDGSPWII